MLRVLKKPLTLFGKMKLTKPADDKAKEAPANQGGVQGRDGEPEGGEGVDKLLQKDSRDVLRQNGADTDIGTVATDQNIRLAKCLKVQGSRVLL